MKEQHLDFDELLDTTTSPLPFTTLQLSCVSCRLPLKSVPKPVSTELPWKLPGVDVLSWFRNKLAIRYVNHFWEVIWSWLQCSLGVHAMHVRFCVCAIVFDAMNRLWTIRLDEDVKGWNFNLICSSDVPRPSQAKPIFAKATWVAAITKSWKMLPCNH